MINVIPSYYSTSIPYGLKRDTLVPCWTECKFYLKYKFLSNTPKALYIGIYGLTEKCVPTMNETLNSAVHRVVAFRAWKSQVHTFNWHGPTIIKYDLMAPCILLTQKRLQLQATEMKFKQLVCGTNYTSVIQRKFLSNGEIPYV